MTSWGSIIAEEIDRQRRQEAAECDESSEGSEGGQNRNAAFPACHRGSAAPSWVLRPEEQPDGDTLDDWRAWMLDKYRQKVASGRYADKANALADVWSAAERVWHLRHGTVPDRGTCAGCGDVIYPGMVVISIIDGARVHADPDCLNGYGERFREVARAALVELGLKPPNPPDDC